MKVSPASTSVVEKLPTTVPTGWFSGRLVAVMAMSVGAALGESSVSESGLAKSTPLIRGVTASVPTKLPAV